MNVQIFDLKLFWIYHSEIEINWTGHVREAGWEVVKFMWRMMYQTFLKEVFRPLHQIGSN